MRITKRNLLIYIATVIFSVAYILVAREIALKGYPGWQPSGSESYVAKVTQILAVVDTEEGARITFQAELKQGQQKGETVQAMQTIHTKYYPVQERVAAGDSVLLYQEAYSINTPWMMLDYHRSNAILWLAALFCLGALIFGHFKGLNTLISLGFTCLAIFYVFLPSVLSVQNIYLWSVVTCLYVTAMTMLFINGASRKSLCAGLGCFAGVIVAGIIVVLMNALMKVTGMTTEETLYLQMLDIANPIDLKGMIFAAILIGALGAIMDVAMDIASSLNEIKLNVPDASYKMLLRTGFNIGRDILGTMVNTLVLAYIGSSLSVTILLVAYNVPLNELFNMELIITELLQALAGSFGMLLCIVFTTMICAFIYTRKSPAHRQGS